MITPSLSVVLPLYNGARYVSEAIDSVITQQALPADWELIIVDDGSTDEGLTVCRRYATEQPNIRLEVFPENRGVAAARNQGVQLARYEYLCFIDQDDQWVQNKWQMQWQALCQHPDHQSVYILAHQDFFIQAGIKPPHWFRTAWLSSAQKGHVLGTLLIGRESFIEVGGLNEQWKYGFDDVAWFLCARELGLHEMMLDEVLLKRRVHDQNFSAQTAHSNPELLRLIRQKLAKQRSTNPT